LGFGDADGFVGAFPKFIASERADAFVLLGCQVVQDGGDTVDLGLGGWD
jgi:hypothetical protein